MTVPAKDYRISRYLAEFSTRAIERSYQDHVCRDTQLHLRIALFIWASLLLLFAISDYSALGLTTPFFYLTAYRVSVATLLIITLLTINPQTDYYKISCRVFIISLISFTGVMLFFVLRPEVTYWTVGVIMLMLMALLMFLPVRFILAFVSAVYGVVITLTTRFVLGSSVDNLIGLFLLLMIPVVVGTAAAFRMAVLQRKQFTLLAVTANINQELENEIKRRQALEVKLTQLAATDPLTGLYNRREYEMLFQHEMERARRMNTFLSVCIIDIDHFKSINDNHGHTAGDIVLKRSADIYRDKLRSMDIIGRLGGDEFVVLLPDTDVDHAITVCEGLLRSLSSRDIDVGGNAIRITATIGVTQMLPDDDDITRIIHRADTALYRAKELGRNRVEAFMG